MYVNVYGHNEALSHLADGHRQRIVPHFRNQIAPLKADQFHLLAALTKVYGRNTQRFESYCNFKNAWIATRAPRNMDKRRIKECFFLLYLAGTFSLRDFLMKSCRPSAVIWVVLEVRGRNLKRSWNKRNFAGKKNSQLLHYRQRCCLSRFESFHMRTIKFLNKKSVV